MSLDDTPLRVILAELPPTYERAAATTPTVERVPTGRAANNTGSQPPPGAQDMLDADEYHKAITPVNDWAEFVAHVLTDEVDGLGAIPGDTYGQLSLISRWPDHFDNHDDPMLRYAIGLDARDHLTALRRIANRGTRIVRKLTPCLDVACTGQYTATLTGTQATGDLVCSRCQGRVPADQWERWGAKTEWVTPTKAASMLGAPVSTIHTWASRRKWARQGRGRDIKYSTLDVRAHVADGVA